MERLETCLHRTQFRDRFEYGSGVTITRPGFKRKVRETCGRCGGFIFEQIVEGNTPEPIPEAEYIEGLKTILLQREEATAHDAGMVDSFKDLLRMTAQSDRYKAMWDDLR